MSDLKRHPRDYPSPGRLPEDWKDRGWEHHVDCYLGESVHENRGGMMVSVLTDENSARIKEMMTTIHLAMDEHGIGNVATGNSQKQGHYTGVYIRRTDS